MQNITIQLSDNVFQLLYKRARVKNQTVEDEVVAAVENTVLTDVSEDTDAALAQLAFLEDPDLWQAARMTVPVDMSERMQALVIKEQSKGLTPAKEEEAQELQRYGQHVMLVRAEAAALLRERGQDIRSLRQLPLRYYFVGASDGFAPGGIHL